MVYLNYITMLRYTILVRNPWFITTILIDYGGHFLFSIVVFFICPALILTTVYYFISILSKSKHFQASFVNDNFNMSWCPRQVCQWYLYKCHCAWVALSAHILPSSERKKRTRTERQRHRERERERESKRERETARETERERERQRES